MKLLASNSIQMRILYRLMKVNEFHLLTSVNPHPTLSRLSWLGPYQFYLFFMQSQSRMFATNRQKMETS